MKNLPKDNKGVWTLLKENLSKGQLIGYSVANIVGLTVILTGVLFFCDSRHSDASDDKFFSDDYIVVSKKVDGIGLNPVSFSKDEIAEISNQEWVKKVGEFTSSQFAVNGSIEFGGRGLSSYLFCESVPDEFFDTKPENWGFDPEERFVPIMLSKDYLALYNFGFALPQGLPQVSEEIVGAVPIRLRITGDGNNPEYFNASIVGFSSRLNTIAVPQDFMDWANSHFSIGEKADPSRLIIKIDRMKSSEMKEWFDQRDIEIAGDKADTGRVSDFLSIVSAVVTTNGFIISILAVFILLLSIFLLLQKSREKLRNLLLLGYSPREVGIYYERLVIIGNAIITAICIGLTFIFRIAWAGRLHTIGLGHASVLPMLATALIYFIVVSIVNVYVIRLHLMRIWKGN